MFYKPRTKPKELITLELLNNRMIFLEKICYTIEV